jgi:hypothetical protein
MTQEEREYLFELKCKSKLGQTLSEKEQTFCRKMFELYPTEYALDSKAVFEATKPFGA